MDRLRICFVCTGNICRSPVAEVVFGSLAERAGIARRIVVDSAGTHGWHQGDDMDGRSRRSLLDGGYAPAMHAARLFGPADFGSRDLVVALDTAHLTRLAQLAGLSTDPEHALGSLALLRSFDPSAPDDDLDVADPYYGDTAEFDEVLAQVERACAGLLDRVQGRISDQPAS